MPVIADVKNVGSLSTTAYLVSVLLTSFCVRNAGIGFTSMTDKETEGRIVSLAFRVRELLVGLRSGARKSAGPGAFLIIKVYFLRIDRRSDSFS